MADRQFIMDLAKLLIAAAWADGKMQYQERHVLKDLLFSLDEISGRDWSELEMYMGSPITEQERVALLQRVLGHIRSESDKTFVLGMLRRVFEADGVITQEERRELAELEEAISRVDTGLWGQLTRTMRTAMGRGRPTDESALRESRLDDYVHNRIYFHLQAAGERENLSFDKFPEETIRQVSLAAGLMAQVALVDTEVSEKEHDAIKQVFIRLWDLPERHADLVARISCDRALEGLEFYHLTRGFFDTTTYEQRKEFLAALFAVANASNRTTLRETEEIRKISEGLRLSHDDFIEAKLTVPDRDHTVFDKDPKSNE